jgi:hypothetical protein
MYEIVKTSQQQETFERTWEHFCNKYGWYNDPYAKNGVRYILFLPGGSRGQKKVIGTVEFIPYDPKNPDSTVENRCRFSKYEEIRLHQDQSWEIDKLCIHEEYQRQGYFQLFMYVFHDHATKHKPKYYLALMEKKFYRMLRISFGFKVVQKGEAQIGPTTSLIPVVFDIEKMMQEEEKVKLLLTTASNLNLIKKSKSNEFGLLSAIKWSNKLKLTRSRNNNLFKKMFSR